MTAPLPMHTSQDHSPYPHTSFATLPPTTSPAGIPLLAMTQQYFRRQLRNIAPGEGLTRVWLEFYRSFDPWIRQQIAGAKLPRHLQDDCHQDAWLEIARRLPSFEDSGELRRLKSWMALIVRSKAAEIHRQTSRQNRLVRGFQLEIQIRATHRAPDAATKPLMGRETRESVANALHSLRLRVGDTNFQMFCARQLDGASVADIAVEFQLPPRSVTYRIHRTAAQLRALANDSNLRDALQE